MLKYLLADNSRNAINTDNSLLVELLQTNTYSDKQKHSTQKYHGARPRSTGSPLLRQVDPIQQLSFRRSSLYLALSVSEGTFYGDPQQNT